MAKKLSSKAAKAAIAANADITGIPPELITRIQAMARRTWETIASDYIQCSLKNTVSRAEAVEGTLDADRMKEYGGDPAAYAAWKELSFEQQEAVCLPAFPFSRYSL